MEEKFTIQEIKNYIISQDSLGDVLYHLTEENIKKGNTFETEPEEFETEPEEFETEPEE